MKIVDGKIVEATEKELFDYWLTRGYDDIMSFPQFIKDMLRNGVIINGYSQDECKINF